MTHVEVTDATGTRWIGDPSTEPLTDSDRDKLGDLLSNFKELNYLSLEIGGTKHYFNPIHILAVSVHGGI